MSASIDTEDPTDGGSGAREVLVCWLETHAAGECDAATLQSGFLDGCRLHADAPWDALALLDQYQRRGKLEPQMASVLKREIEEMVFGTPGQAGARPRGAARIQSVPSARPGPVRATPPRDLAREQGAAAAREADDEDEEDQDDEEEAELEAVEPPPVIAPVQPRPRTPTPARSPVRVLRKRYELQEILGRGADGVVYRALDRNRQHLDEAQRHVAIKLLHNEPPLSDQAVVDFQRSAHRMQALVHPNRVRVLDFDADGSLRFLVMDCVPGATLSALLEREDKAAVAMGPARQIIADVGAALADAHEHGLVVGNCTPRKIIVTPGGGAKLIDVGFATAAGTSALEADPYAARYASADVIGGRSPTASDDVYSFACVAYELLARRHPYGGRSGAAARAHHLHPERIASLPPAAWSTLERALRWDRSERDVSAAQVASALTGAELHADVEPAIRAPRRETPDAPARPRARWFWGLVLVASICATAWWLLPPVDQAEVRERIGAVEDAMDSGRTGADEAAPPVDTARKLSGNQLIPAQPAPGATLQAPAARDPALESTEAAQSATSQVPAASGSTVNGVLGFTKETYVVRESDVVVRIPVVRMRGSRGEVSFRWWVEGNSADAGEDFAAVEPAREYIAAGQNSTVLHIPLVSDSVREGTEMFTVHIGEPGPGAQLGELTRATVIVVDDD